MQFFYFAFAATVSLTASILKAEKMEERVFLCNFQAAPLEQSRLSPMVLVMISGIGCSLLDHMTCHLTNNTHCPVTEAIKILYKNTFHELWINNRYLSLMSNIVPRKMTLVRKAQLQYRLFRHA